MTQIRTGSPFPLRLAACAMLSLLSACGAGSKNTSQVAVKVNSDEISVLQLNQRLARISSAGMSDDQKLSAQKKTLEGLVDQELLIEQARAKQLDRDPNVVSALEAAREQILADAYVQKQILPNAKPSDAEIQKYYDDNPDLFAQRRVYALQEALVPAMTLEQREELKKRLAKGNMEEALRWLKAQDVKMSANMGVRAAEQVPMAMLSRIARGKDGTIEFFEGPNFGANIVKIVSSQPAPVDLKAARSSIEQFLTNRKRDELVQAEVKRLRDAAKIQYVGEFQKLAMQTEPVPEKTPVAVGAAPADAASKSADAIAKGLKGL